jgi:hypothetical protein
VVDVFITPMGSELVQQVQEEIRAALAPYTDRLPADDRHMLTRLLDSLSGTPTRHRGKGGSTDAL